MNKFTAAKQKAFFRDASAGADLWVSRQYGGLSKPLSTAALKRLMGAGFDAGRRWAQTALGEPTSDRPGERKYWVDFNLSLYSHPLELLVQSWNAGMASGAGKHLQAAKPAKKRTAKKRTAKKRTAKR